MIVIFSAWSKKELQQLLTLSSGFRCLCPATYPIIHLVRIFQVVQPHHIEVNHVVNFSKKKKKPETLRSAAATAIVVAGSRRHS